MSVLLRLVQDLTRGLFPTILLFQAGTEKIPRIYLKVGESAFPEKSGELEATSLNHTAASPIPLSCIGRSPKANSYLWRKGTFPDTRKSDLDISPSGKPAFFSANYLIRKESAA